MSKQSINNIPNLPPAGSWASDSVPSIVIQVGLFIIPDRLY